MGIPIHGGRRSRRSYADYKPPGRKTGPRNDPFRIIFYLVLIAAGIWVNLHPDQVRNLVQVQMPQNIPVVAGSPATSTPQPEQFATQGEQAYLDGQLDKAVEFYRQAATYAPNNVEYHVQVTRMLLFQSAMQYGDRREATLQDALTAANSAILANPERPEGYAIMGKVLDWSDKPEEAASQILRALEIDPNNAVAQSYLAEALVDQDRWDQAMQTIEGALALDPNNVDIRRDYGYILERMGDYAAAAAQYEASIQLQPKLSYVRMSLGKAYREVGRYQEALDQFFAVATLEPQNALVPFEIGRTYETYIGDPASALQYYERAVQLDEQYSKPWVRIGTLRYLQGSYVQAIPAFEKALELGVQTVDVYYQLGLSYANQGNCVEALTNLQKAQGLATGDQRILDAIAAGFEMCNQTPVPPTPTP